MMIDDDTLKQLLRINDELLQLYLFAGHPLSIRVNSNPTSRIRC